MGVPLLLTDGTVFIQNPLTRDWYKLTPTNTGSYLNGTWSKMASLPSGYGPLYYASSVLADGRVVLIGGEYNLNQGAVWTNKGAWYNPVTNVWTNLAPPAGWNTIGDAQCTVMPDGKFLLASILDTKLAILNPATMTWSSLAGTGKQSRFDEEGWALMPDGTVLTLDALAAPKAEKYIPWLDKWMPAGSTPQSLEDPGSQELGPMVLLPNGKVFAMGATGHNAVYTPGATPTDPGSWVAAPDFPNINGQLDIADGPACLLPNGKVLCYASPGIFNSPSHFFEYDGNALLEVQNIPNSAGNPSYVGNMLLLPTGQVLFTDFSNDVRIYNPDGGPQEAWRPTITDVPASLVPGQSYLIKGTQFNGVSQGNAYGDDSTNFSNYPLVRITNNATGHVRYCRTHDHSTMAVATGAAIVSTNVDIPANIELGASTIEVVTNGIPSHTVNVTVGSTTVVLPNSYTIVRGQLSSGTLNSLFNVDNDYLSVFIGLVLNASESPLQVEMKGTAPSETPSSLQLTLVGKVDTVGTTQSISLYNFTTNAYEVVDMRAGTTSNQTVTVTGTGLLSRFVQPGTKELRALVSYKQTGIITIAHWKANFEQLNWLVQ